MSYAVREPEIRQVYVVRAERLQELEYLHETEIVGKQYSGDFDKQLKDQ